MHRILSLWIVFLEHKSKIKIMVEDKVIHNAFRMIASELRRQAAEVCVEVDIPAETHLLNVGETCTELCYLVEGAVYQYNYLDESDLNIIDLHVPGDWVFNHESFVSRDKSKVGIKAFSPSKLLKINLHAVHHLIGISQQFLGLGGILQDGRDRINFFDSKLGPKEKYDFITKNKPEIIQAFPLKMIASYLKITPETISRVRSVKPDKK